MPRYTPGVLSSKDPTKEELINFIKTELKKIQDVMTQLDEGRRDVQYVEPTKPRVGQLAYADGTKWNPGGGEGLYYNNSAGTWSKINPFSSAVTSFNTRTGDVTLTSADVTGALTYTPLNSATYTAADVLAKIKTVDGAGSGLDADLLDGLHRRTDLSDFTTWNGIPGFVGWYGIGGGPGTTAFHHGYRAVMADTNYGHEMAVNHANDEIYFRRYAGGYGSWRRIWHDGNDGPSSGLDADSVDGYAPYVGGSGPTWGTTLGNIKSDGVMEVGYILDWHMASASASDYDVRLYCGSTHDLTEIPGDGSASGVLLHSGNHSEWPEIVTASYAIQPYDTLVNCQLGAAAITVTLPAASSLNGRSHFIIVRRHDGGVPLLNVGKQVPSNNIYNSAGSPVGGLSFSGAGKALMFVSDGANNWYEVVPF